MTSAKAAAGDYDVTFLTELYHIFLNREPDPVGFDDHLRVLRAGLPLHKLVEAFLKSDEFSSGSGVIATAQLSQLPNLRYLYPDHYEGDLYLAINDDQISMMEELIITHGYYDHFGVWSHTIDPDKLNIAQLAQTTGAKSCLEIGCFNGAVLSVLRDRGVEVTGVDLSHLAFVIAFPNVRNRLLYGDLLSVTLENKYDCILLFDVLEHLSPLKLGYHIGRLRELLAPNGIIMVNSPMFGFDAVFGTVFEPSQAGNGRHIGTHDFFRYWPCDERGWPMHGHMIWASPKWWTRQFEVHDLIRVRVIEEAVQSQLSGYFSWAPARKSLFLLAHRDASLDTAAIVTAIHQCEW
jgi:SAM-dependent methyltransferase